MKNNGNFSFTMRLQKWYDVHKRSLPWRDISDPYFIWLSEIILQQTRVNQGLPYYLKFVDRYQSISEFAAATEDEILQLWQGLGYYSRGRNMLKCANAIVEKHGGKFPTTFKELTQLPGIGDYTASAIMSFAYNQAHAVLDGNVYRVLSRMYAIQSPINGSQAHKEFKALAESLIDQKQPGKHNQAIMEFGALQCVPSNPICSECVFNDTCIALHTNQVHSLPAKIKKKAKRKRHFNYLVFLHNHQVLIQQRTGKGIWQGLHEFPLIESEKKLSAKDVLNRVEADFNLKKPSVLSVVSFKHILTHQSIYADFWIVPTTSFGFNLNSDIFEVDLQALGKDFAIPVLLDKFLESAIIKDLCR